MEKEVEVVLNESSGELPLVYHERKSSVPLSELKQLYDGCNVKPGHHDIDVVMPDGMTVLRIPSRAIEREAEIHYLPLEEILRPESSVPLGPCGYAVPFLLARHFGLANTNYGVYPCNMEIDDRSATTFEVVDLNEGIPEYLLLYSAEWSRITPERAPAYLKVRIQDKILALIAVPVGRAAEICSMKDQELLDTISCAFCNAQEVEWRISQKKST